MSAMTSQLPKPNNEAAMLVGQPCSLEGWFMTVAVRCKCDGDKVVLIVGSVGAMNQCPHCKRFIQIGGLQIMPNNEINFSFNILTQVKLDE